MPKSALPPHLWDVENNFPDDSQFGDTWYGRIYRWFKKTTKTWFVFGPRATEWWARWREWPITLIAFFGEGQTRWENDIIVIKSTNAPIFLYNSVYNKFYLSRLQSWVKWHFQVQWPLFLTGHVYIKDKMWFAYVGFKRDADKIYWLSLTVGVGGK